MQGLLLCCLVALATCQNLRYDVGFNPKKTYEYKYEGSVNFGLGNPNLAESGAKLTSKIKISGVSAQTFVLQVSDLKFEEFNGFPEKATYEASMKLTQRIAAQLTKPIVFDYVSGHVADIRASAEVSETVVNIVRGILGFFTLTVKTTQKIYELEEVGIHGMCQSQYITEENPQTQELVITQVVNVNNCREKAAMFRGMAMALPDRLTTQKGESVVSTLRYVYTVKPTAEGGLITAAHGMERQHFSPFNVKGGSFKMLATKELTLLGVTDTTKPVTSGPLESRGNLIYKFVNLDANPPIMMQDLQDPIPKAIELIKSLAKANEYQVDSATTEETMRLYQLLRAVPYEGLEKMWKQLSPNAEHRRWFLDMIAEVNDVRVLKFLEARFQAADVTTNEALQTIMIAFDHLHAQPELVEYAKRFLSMPFSKTSIYLWQTVMLSYGTLVYRHCAYTTPCPVTAVQPLLDMATESLRRRNDTDMVLALKALGNAGHPSSIKTIMRFLPGVAANPVDLPPRVLSAAVQSMRLIAARDPHSVQDITLNLFLQRNLPSEIRMLAFVILLETKPSPALISTITVYLENEKDLHVASFAYSYLQSIARSRTPDNHYLSIASSVAVKILSPKLGRLSYSYSKAGRLDWFSKDFLVGTATEVLMLRSANSLFPTQMTTKSSLYAIGRIMELMEVGFHADGLSDLLSIPGFKGDFSLSDLLAILSALQNWESLPSDKPVITAFSRLSGQEWFFADMSKEFIRYIIMATRSTAGKDSPLWSAIENLQKGFSFHWTKPFLTFEARFMEATLLGLPVEISKFYHAVTGIKANAKAAIAPQLTGQLGQVLNSQISLESDGFIGFTKDIWLFYGINTELFQCGSEFKSKIPVSAPWNFAANINIPERKLAIDLPPYKKEINIISVTSNVYAVSRNIEELSSPKVTPMMPDRPEEMGTSSIWQPKARMCSDGSIYGVNLCLDYELRRQYYQEQYPLYYILGYTHMSFGVAPAQATKGLDRIRLEINAGTTKTPVDVQQLLQNLRKMASVATERVRLSSESSSAEEINLSQPDILMALNSTPEALFNFKALAMTGSQKTGGYDASVYYTPEANSQNAQLIVTKVGEDTNWKMCVDTSMDIITEAKAHVRWGAECQSYEMSMIAGAVLQPDVKPTLKAKVHWNKIPDSMEEMGTRLESYIPGMAFFMGFSQQDEKNPKQEVSAAVVAASADSFDVKIRLPKYTVYRQAIPLPVMSASYQELYQNITNPTSGRI